MKDSDQSFLVLIPALNEEKTISSVIAPLIAENIPVVVVDDGSTDGTAFESAYAGAVVVIFPKNRGKADAVRQALRFPVKKVLLLDADLTNFTREHATQVKKWLSQYDCARIELMGGRTATTLSHMISPALAGQRILSMSILSSFFGECSVNRFQLEVALEDFLKKHGYHEEDLVLKGVGQVMKEEKRGLWKGIIARLGMYKDIIQYKLKSRAA
ncbi:glycosyltransferase [Coprothermobacter platensis]|uniref:glycosyltransferase n=1 Tax=Coprothermobacter platensis TaxID=108819 RepID=UPI0003778D43|nr:glycosyltransferase [Coprothermobacter platensis]